MNDMDLILELMDRYDEYRATWEDEYGHDFDEQEFHQWFTHQVTEARACT